MAYKWRPSAAQRKEFAQNMQDDEFKREYEAKKAKKAAKKRETSRFYYETAGGNYVSTKVQYDFAMTFDRSGLNSTQINAFEQIIYGYTCKEKVHHDNIHIVNKLIRKAG